MRVGLLPVLVRLLDRLTMADAARQALRPVCLAIEGEVGADGMTTDEAREIMAEIDAKASALLAVLAIILATSAFVFSLDQTWVTLALMFAQVATVSVSILFLLRCLVYEPAPRLRRLMALPEVTEAYALQAEAIVQVVYFNRVIVLTVATCLLFFAMSIVVGIDAMATVR